MTHAYNPAARRRWYLARCQRLLKVGMTTRGTKRKQGWTSRKDMTPEQKRERLAAQKAAWAVKNK
jgi:hypothetical protein